MQIFPGFRWPTHAPQPDLFLQRIDEQINLKYPLVPRAAHQGIDRVALQPTNGHGHALLGIAHADLFAQVFGRTDAGAHAAQRVGVENGLRRATQIGICNAADEGRDIDLHRAGLGTGRIKQYRQRLASSSACVAVNGGTASAMRTARSAACSAGRRREDTLTTPADFKFKPDQTVGILSLTQSACQCGRNVQPSAEHS